MAPAEEKKGQGRLFAATTEPWERLGDLAVSMTHLDDAPDGDIGPVVPPPSATTAGRGPVRLPQSS